VLDRFYEFVMGRLLAGTPFPAIKRTVLRRCGGGSVHGPVLRVAIKVRSVLLPVSMAATTKSPRHPSKLSGNSRPPLQVNIHVV
jgi:hypothetical protein